MMMYACTHACRTNKELGDTSWNILYQVTDEFGGWAKKYKGLDPSLDLVLEPRLCVEFLGFKRAKGNSFGTLTRLSQQLKCVLPFLFAGRCPDARETPPNQATLITQWYANIVAYCKQQDALEGDNKPPTDWTSIMAEQWELCDGPWKDVMDEFKVNIV